MANDDRFFIIALAATSLCGGTAWLINPRLGGDELTACLDQDRIEVVIHAPQYASRLDDFPGDKVSTSTFASLAASSALVPKQGRKSRCVLLTGGTTAAPTAVTLKRRWSAPLPALALAGEMGVRHGVSTLICAPLFHGHGLACMMLCFLSGSPLVLSSACRSRDLSQLGKGDEKPRLQWGEAIYSTICREEIGTVIGVPSQLRSLARYLEENDPAPDAEQVTSVISGSDRLDVATINTLHRRWGPVVTNYYGTTETGTITMISGPMLQERPSSVGTPVAGSRIRIVDDDGMVVPQGKIGRIQAVSPLASLGSSLHAYTTSDLGWLDANGYLYIEGRADAKQRAGGEFVSLSQVEAVLSSVDGVKRVQAYMVPDETHGQRVAAKVTVSGDTFDVEAVRDLVRRRLGPPAVPAILQVTPEDG